jgi:HK97 family phage major capsid protein
MDAELRKTGGFKCQGEFLVAVRKFYDGERHDSRIEALQKAALNESTDSQGGVFVPEQWAAPIYNAATEGSLVRSRATVLNMTSDRLNVPILVDSDRSTSFFGGVTVTWLAEQADQYATTVAPAIGRCGLTAHKAVATCYVANELEQDYDAFGAFFTKAFGEAVRFYEDDRFIWGTGSGQPLGIMNGASLIQVTRAAGWAAATPADIGGMAGRFLPGSWRNAVWITNQKTLTTWAGLQATSGTNGLGPVDLSSMTILNRPLIVSEHLTQAWASGDLILADFSQYLVGDRGMIISASRHATYSSGTYGWTKDQTLWKIALRVDGQPLLPAAITPLRGGETLSSFVTLTSGS